MVIRLHNPYTPDNQGRPGGTIKGARAGNDAMFGINGDAPGTTAVTRSTESISADTKRSGGVHDPPTQPPDPPTPTG